MFSRIFWPSVLIVSFTVAGCGRKSSEEEDAGASGGAVTGGSTPESAGGSAGTPGGGSSGSDSGPLAELGDCSPLDDTCPEGTYCQVRDGRTECIEEGRTERDDLCEKTGTCQRGSICLGAGEFSGKRCQEPCPLDEDSWSVCDIGRHTCFVAMDDEGNELPFGVCRY